MLHQTQLKEADANVEGDKGVREHDERKDTCSK